MSQPGSGLVDWVLRRLAPAPIDVSLGPEELSVAAKPVRLALPAPPFRIRMGEQQLDVHPEPLLVGDGLDTRAVVLVDPAAEGTRSLARLRIAPGEELGLDAEQRDQHGLYSVPGEIRRRRPVISHEGDALVIRVAIAEPATTLSLLPEPAPGRSLLDGRRRALARLLDLYGQRFEPLSAEQALETLQEVNGIIAARNDWQPRDTRGEPGALLVLPDGIQPVFIGDIHGRIDNLLSLLSRDGLLAAVDAGRVALVFLGDLVHHDDPRQLEQMRSSMLVMDLVMRLKLRYPRGVFVLIGNHDSFSSEVMKGGVPQGLLWEQALRSERGDAYRDALARFYAISPLVMRGARCCACHAGPPTMAVTRRSLVDAHCNPALAHELTWIRCAAPGVTHGYRAGDVRQLRRALDLPRDTDMVVGHFPRSIDETVWMDSDHIRGHHVLFSARDHVAGMMLAIDGQLVPQVRPVEALAAAVASGAIGGC